VKFWDSSALVPLLVEEELTAAVRELLRLSSSASMIDL
jgi:predicted nucleic acid-binding protein